MSAAQDQACLTCAPGVERFNKTTTGWLPGQESSTYSTQTDSALLLETQTSLHAAKGENLQT